MNKYKTITYVYCVKKYLDTMINTKINTKFKNKTATKQYKTTKFYLEDMIQFSIIGKCLC